MYLVDDSAEMAFLDPAVVAGGLVAVAALGYGLWSRVKLRRHPRRGPGYDVFRRDVASALAVWGAAEILIIAAWFARIEGLRMPIWSYVGLVVGLAILAFAWRREHGPWPTRAKAEEDDVLPDGTVPRGLSETWEMGAVAGGILALASYLVTVDHPYGHPIHWATTALSFVVGYALGLAAWTPRFKLSAVRAQRNRAGSAVLRGKRTKRHAPSNSSVRR